MEHRPKLNNPLETSGDILFKFYNNNKLPRNVLDAQQQAQQDVCTDFLRKTLTDKQFLDDVGESLPWPIDVVIPEYITMHVYYGEMSVMEGKCHVEVRTECTLLDFVNRISCVLNHGSVIYKE